MHKHYLGTKVVLESSTMMVRFERLVTWNVAMLIGAQGWDWKNWKENEGTTTTTTTKMKANEGYELEWFRRWEGGTLEIWSRQMTKRPRNINVSNDYFFDGMW
jgi:hypothetical protein